MLAEGNASLHSLATVPQRTHPFTPLLTAVRVIPPLYIGVLVVGVDFSSRVPLPGFLIAGFIAIAAALVVAAISAVAWWRLTYYFDADGDLRVNSGLLQRQVRRLQLSRLQSVDAVAPLIPRLFGFVELRVEVAGSGDSRVVLRFLRRDEATKLQEEILSRHAQQESVASADEVGPAVAPLATGDLLATVPTGRLLISLLLRTSTVALFIFTALFVAMTVAFQGWAALVLALITGGVPLFAIVREFLTYSDFTVTRSRQGLRLRSGLLQTQSRTVPAGRVQAAEFIAPLLWRRFDWVRVQLTVAGTQSEGSEVGRTVLLPVAPRAQAMSVLPEVMPGLNLDDIAWVCAPPGARWRAPVQWKFLAFAETAKYIVTRSGRITRRMAFASHDRVQSVGMSEGLWQRRLGLASVEFHIAPGPINITSWHMDLAQARPLVNREIACMLLAARAV